MDPCEDLRVDLDIAIETRRNARWELVIRAFLGVIGFEWVYDLIKHKKIEWSILIDLLVALDFAAAVAWLVNVLRDVGLSGVAGELVKKLGPWALAFLIAILIVEIGLAISKWIDVDDQFEWELKRLYRESECPDKDAIFKEKGLEVPSQP